MMLAMVSLGGRQAVLQILVTLPEDLQVEREHSAEQPAASRVDQTLDEDTIAHHIQLEPERMVAVSFATSSIEQMLIVDRVNGMPAFSLRAPRGSRRRMLHARESGGRDGDGHRDVLPIIFVRVERFSMFMPRAGAADLVEIRFVRAIGALGP